MNIQEIQEIICECEFKDYIFEAEIDHRGSMYLQAIYFEPDVNTLQIEKQCTRKWFLSPEMCKSEVVQTAFKCVLTSMEHRTREFFKYRGRGIFGPHFDVNSLWEICNDGNLDWRGRDETKKQTA